MARTVMTVLGPIDPQDLGFTSMHEHVLMDGRIMRHQISHEFPPEIAPLTMDDAITLENAGFMKRNSMMAWDAIDLQDEEMMTSEVAAFRATGGRSMLECSGIGIRCNVAGVKRIAEKTGVQIIQATGFYTGDCWPDSYKGKTADELYRMLMGEVENGIGDTGVRPGALKLAMLDYTRDEEAALRALARVSKETGMCFTLHPPYKAFGNAVQAVHDMMEEGADPERIIIAHVAEHVTGAGDLASMITDPEHTWVVDLEYAKSLLDLGVTISCEFLGNEVGNEMLGECAPVDWMRLAGIYKLLEQGYAKQIVFGTDTCTKELTLHGGGEGYTRLTRAAMFTLRKILGISEQVLDQITVKNPARLLAF